MGYGSLMNVVNQRPTAITTYVTDQTCMHDNGEEGSNLSLFNNATIQGQASLPGGSGQYIEVKNSGSCWFGSGLFTLQVNDAASGTTLATLSFSDKTASWGVDNDHPEIVNVNINNSGPQGVISITAKAS